jgi:hypothetical protein
VARASLRLTRVVQRCPPIVWCQSLEAEYARMPLGAGRSLRERERKAVVEARLELLARDISGCRMQLKRLAFK